MVFGLILEFFVLELGIGAKNGLFACGLQLFSLYIFLEEFTRKDNGLTEYCMHF